VNFEGTSEHAGKAFLRGQRRMLVTTIVGYTLFYFLRKNLSLAMPGLAQDYGITKSSLGLFLTLHGVVYGLGKFVCGPLSDRSRPRRFLCIGLGLALVCNVVFGFGPVLAKLFAGGAEGAAFTTALIAVLGVAWVANGFFQSMGNPPCLKLLSHWVPPGELATKLAIWNSSHSIGAGLVTILCGYIMGLGALGADGVGVGMWKWCFWMPAIIAGVGLAALVVWLPGTPEEEGMGGSRSRATDTDAQERVPPADAQERVPPDSAITRVYLNPVIWTVGLCCFMVYLTRFAILDWGPMLMKEAKGVSLVGAGWTVACFEIAGILGTLFSGWATDRLAGGRAPRVCLFMMLGAAAFMGAFWLIPAGSSAILYVAALSGAGFCIYGPQAMTGATAVNIATRRFAGTAVGFTSLFSYASVLFSGWGMGALSEATGGWTAPFLSVVAATILGAGLFLALWSTKPNGY
jgi:OPA family glycerol-3-phosphate transporter-like MFS transporter/OPA family sugar phosphate sensor protein UhpC-like MFS transporter